MSVVYIGVASIVLSLFLLWVVEKFVSKAATKTDVSAELRELLLAKAEGRISQDEYDVQQAALHATLLQSAAAPGSAKPAYVRWLIPALVVLVVAGVYWGMTSHDSPPLGGTEDFSKLPGAEPKPQANSGGDLNTVVKRLADKMANDPKNGDGWLLLAKTYGELRKFPEAAAAYEKAAAILPADATLLADWADAYVMSKGGKWDEAARKIVKRALEADAKHVKSLALAGSEAFDRAEYKAAIALWKRMKQAAPADSMDQKLADANIEEANARLSGKKPGEATAAVSPGEAPGVGGLITLSAKLSSKVAADDTVFVVAKATEGGGPPLAVKRFKGSDFPIRFRLDDSAAIMPSRTISQHAEVLVSAMVSKSGKADAKAGDIYGTPVKVKLGADNLKMELDQVR
ncbi:MAG: hypothetical protein H6R15_1668 [Proteobacteria bacterium]|nr:hypothetical protein [Pseudomonadota bacterium]